MPAAGKSSGAFFVPEIGANVWIEFEQGDPDYPIWTGCLLGHSLVDTADGRGLAAADAEHRAGNQRAQLGTIFGLPAAGVALSAGPLGPSPSITVMPTAIVIKCASSLISVTPAGVDIVGAKITLNGTALVVT